MKPEPRRQRPDSTWVIPARHALAVLFLVEQLGAAGTGRAIFVVAAPSSPTSTPTATPTDTPTVTPTPTPTPGPSGVAPCPDPSRCVQMSISNATGLPGGTVRTTLSFQQG